MKELLIKIRDQINKYFVGKEDVTEMVLTALLAKGHILIEDVPGVGKTTLAKTLADSIDASFARIQFTPDTLPGDVLGISVYNMATREFEFHEGVIMNQIILADEINRTSPKTQSSLLEAMAEGQVSVDGNQIKLPKPFIVIATQNPIGFLGTYPLPEAQTDRFLMRISIGYPDEGSEILMAKKHLSGELSEKAEPVCTAADILKLQAQAEKVYINDSVLKYIRDITELTRTDKRFVTGLSPRAFLALTDASRARAFIEGRDYVTPDDVKAVALNVMVHRLKLTNEARIGSESPEKILRSLILSVKVPMEAQSGR
ncbi:MAG: MoxR family ATPase [Lachnospiraceae bacterium]|nr:MoxR family ATPase [Lachnospiraceae bacterium]